MCVCVFVRSWELRLNSLGAWGAILGAMGASWAEFWVLGRSLGHHFGVSGLLLGSILGVWGPLGLHFWGSGASLAP